MTNTFVPIYTLRSRCKKHKLDTVRTFTLKNSESPKEAFDQMEQWVLLDWPKTHNCTHHVTFTRAEEKGYRYNTKTKQVLDTTVML